jgi:hypothetical protein
LIFEDVLTSFPAPSNNTINAINAIFDKLSVWDEKIMINNLQKLERGNAQRRGDCFKV